MKIAFVCPEYHPVPPVDGGAVETWIEEVSRRLTNHKIVVCSIYSSKIGRVLDRGHIHYQYYKKGLLAKILLSTYKLPFKNSFSFLYFLPYSFWHARMLRKNRPEIIHIHDRPQFVKIFRRLHPQAKIILHVHQVSAFDERNLWTRELFDAVDAFVGPSIFLTEKIKTLFPAIASKTHFVYNGVDLGQFQSLQENTLLRNQIRRNLNLGDRKVFLYVGRFAENKGADILLEAFRRVVGSRPNEKAMLVFCGAKGFSSKEVTPYMEGLFEKAKALGGQVIFTEYVPHEKIHEYYVAADVLVVPSRAEEGFGMVAIEAMASGLPVIASGQGALPEVVRDGVNGMIVTQNDTEGFEKALNRYLDNPDAFAALGHAGRKRAADSFSWEKITLSVEALYTRVAS